MAMDRLEELGLYLHEWCVCVCASYGSNDMSQRNSSGYIKQNRNMQLFIKQINKEQKKVLTASDISKLRA